MREWEEQSRTATYDPTALLHQMAEILEKETNAFIAGDPDPFEVCWGLLMRKTLAVTSQKGFQKRIILCSVITCIESVVTAQYSRS